MKRIQFESEADLAKALIAWLCEHHWEVYQEVQITTGGRCADIVAVQGPLVWIIETKQALSMAVLEQAWDWRRCNNAHFVSVATPVLRSRGGAHDFVAAVMKQLGMGWLQVMAIPDTNGSYSTFHNGDFVQERVHPRLFRKIRKDQSIRERLCEEHKTFAAAGNSDGYRLTPWALTCRNILLVVTREPGLALDDLIGKISHHYRSHQAARSCLYQWLRKGIVKGVESRKENGRIKVYPITEKPTAQPICSNSKSKRKS